MLKYFLLIALFSFSPFLMADMEVLSFKSGNIELKGELYKPNSQGPYPLLFLNHGSAPKMLNSYAAKQLAKHFNSKNFAVFMPYRRGQGLSEDSGPYIMDLINEAIKIGGIAAGEEVLIRELTTNHLQDQKAAYEFVSKLDFIDKERIISIGNSFGGIQVLLGLKDLKFCAAISASGGAKSWSKSAKLRELMISSVDSIEVPIFFFQAENDYDLSPSFILSKRMKSQSKKVIRKIYPKFGNDPREAHAFFYRSVESWYKDVLDFWEVSCS